TNISGRVRRGIRRRCSLFPLLHLRHDPLYAGHPRLSSFVAAKRWMARQRGAKVGRAMTASVIQTKKSVIPALVAGTHWRSILRRGGLGPGNKSRDDILGLGECLTQLHVK